MNQTQCTFEPQVIAAARLNTISPALQQHLDTCQACQHSFQLATAFNQLARHTEATMPIAPDPDILWLKAQLNAPRRARSAVPALLAAGVMALVAISFVVYRYLYDNITDGSSSGIPVPIGGAPFPTDGTLFVLLLAVALVLFVPHSGGKTVRKPEQERLIAL